MSTKVTEEINNRLNIVDIVGNYVTLKRNGSKYTGLCPFHNEKTPSFTVTPEKNLFYCFGCHKGGSIFNFIMEIENMDFQDALRFLAKKAGVELDDNYSGSSTERKKIDALKELYKRTANSFQYILKNRPEAEEARTYLVKRGVSPEILDLFKLGWAPEDRNWLLAFLKSKGYSDGFLMESGLFSKKGLRYPLFSGRVMFPITNYNGEVIAFSGRTLKDFGPKYINSPETILFQKKRNLFGLSNASKSIREKDFFILCEGQMDVIACHQAGIKNAVAPLGTAYTEEQANILKRYSSHSVISFDGDSAGKKAAAKAIIINEKKDIKSQVAVLGENEDPADLLINKGEKELNKKLKSTINSFDYILENAVNLSDITNPEGKEEVINNLVEYLNSLTSEVRRDDCINMVASRLGVDSASVYKDIKREVSLNKAYRQKKEDNQIKQNAGSEFDRKMSAELFLMIAVVVNRDRFNFVRGKINIEDLFDQRARAIYIALEECFRNNENSIDSLLNRIEGQDLISLIAEKITSEEFSINTEELIRDSVKKIKRSSLLKKREDIVKKLRDMTRLNAEDFNETELLSEKIYIDQEIEKLRLGI